MALSSAIIGELRATDGNDANGCGFKVGASGTDYSQQNGPQATLSALSLVHTTTTQLNVSLTDYTVSANDVGNVFQLAGGSATAGFYEITAVDVPNNRWTVDRSLGTAAQTCPGRMGGALATLGKLATVSSDLRAAFIKDTATYTLTANATFNQARLCLIGYSSTRDDYKASSITGRPTITTATNNINGITLSVSDPDGWQFHNLILSCTAGTKGDAIDHAGNSDYNFLFHRVLIDGWSKAVDSARSSGHGWHRCEVKNCTNTNGAIDLVNNGSSPNTFDSCWIHDNTGKGVRNQQPSCGTYFSNCWITDNGGDGFQKSSQGVTGNGAPVSFVNCVIANNGGDGIALDGSASFDVLTLRNNVIYGNGAYGVSWANIGTWPSVFGGGNSFGANVTAARLGVPTLLGDNALSANPFTDDTTGDYTLNATAGGGADCKANGLPTVIP